MKEKEREREENEENRGRCREATTKKSLAQHSIGINKKGLRDQQNKK